jgi:hypothetical protein
VRALRHKYGDKLALLRELFAEWTDEDLLFALQESAGELELAVGRISEGECGGRRWAQRGRQGAPWAQSAQQAQHARNCGDRGPPGCVRQRAATLLLRTRR